MLKAYSWRTVTQGGYLTSRTYAEGGRRLDRHSRHMFSFRCPSPLSLVMATGLSPLSPRSPRALCRAPRTDAILTVPLFALQQASALLLCRLPLASQDAAHRLRADVKLVCEDWSGECVWVVRMQRAQAFHSRVRKLVRRRPSLGKLCFQGCAVLRPLRRGGVGRGSIVVRLVSDLQFLPIFFLLWLLF